MVLTAGAGGVVGAMDGMGWVVVLVYGGPALVAVGLAGALAGLIARRTWVAPIGVVAFAAVAWWCRVRLGVEGRQAVLFGLAASALVGGAFAAADRGATEDRGPAGNDRHRRAVRAALAVAVLVGAAVVVITGMDHQAASKAEAHTRSQAEATAERFEASPSRTANDLALEAGGQVLEADGDRVDGGADLLVRYEAGAQGMARLVRCWRFRVDGDTVRPPRSEGCPAEVQVPAPRSFGDRLAHHVYASPAAMDQDVDAVEAAAEQAASSLEIDVRVEVAALAPGQIGVSWQTGPVDCFLTLLDWTRFADPTVDTWYANPDLLRSDQVGCHPAAAAG